MTFDEYIQNPMGEKNSVISNRTMYRNYYQGKLDTLLVRENGKVDYKAYHDKKKFILYIKIPSEVVPNFYYDVLIEFREPKMKLIAADLSKYDVRFYSNDPSFVFTFAHAFKKNDMFFMDFADKMSERALKEKADEKNQKDIVGYVKSLYFAYLIMRKRGLFSKLLYINTYDSKYLHSQVMKADKKIELRQQAAKELSLENKKEKQKLKDTTSKRNNQNPETYTSQSSGKIKTTKHTKTIGGGFGKMGKVTKTVKNIKNVRRK